jgi:hypothetical protein
MYKGLRQCGTKSVKRKTGTSPEHSVLLYSLFSFQRTLCPVWIDRAHYYCSTFFYPKPKFTLALWTTDMLRE